MATVGVVKAVISADTTQLKKSLTDAERSIDQMGKKMTKVGRSLTMKVTAPLVGLGAAAGKMASDFEFSMTQIETLVGRSAKEVETLKGSVLGLSGTTGRAPKELADAMFFITSAGLDASSATAALEASAKAAAVGLGDTVIVADAVTNAMNGYGMSADGAAFATDVLAKTVEQGKASAADLAPQFGRLIPMAAELGVSFDQVGAGLAFLTRSSGDAAQSSTQLGGILKSLIKPSQMAKKTMDEIGFSIHEFREAASEDLLTALQDLRVRLEENGKEFGDVIEDARALGGALQLTGVATDQARAVFDELANSSGKLDEAFKGVQKTAQFKLAQAMAGIKASMVTLGQAVLPVVVPLVQALAGVIVDVANAFGSLSGPLQSVVIGMAGAAAAAGPLLMVSGSLVSSWGNLLPIVAKFGFTLGPIAVALGTIGVAAGIVTAALVGQRKEAERDAERLDILQTALREAGDESVDMADHVAGLAAELLLLKGATDDGIEGIEDFNGKGVLLAAMMEEGVRKQFRELGLDMDQLTGMLATGTDQYGILAGQLRQTEGQGLAQMEWLDKNADLLGVNKDKIKELIIAQDLETDTLVGILLALDNTAEAYANNQSELQGQAKALFAADGALVEYERLLDDSTTATVDALLEQGNYAEAMLVANTALEAQTISLKMANFKQRESTSSNRAYGEAVEESTTRLEEMNAAIEAGLDPLGRTVIELENTAVATRDADAAMLAFAKNNSIAARNTAHWAGVAADQARAKAAAEEQDRKRQSASVDFIQARFMIEKKASEKRIADAEKAAQLAEDAKRAATGQIRAQRRLEGIERDRLRLVEDIKDTRRDLLRLAARQADVESDSGDWAIRYRRDLASAALSVMSITDRIRELQATEQATSGVPAAKDAVAHLVDVASAVNTVEQALIDMGVITVTQARIADMSAQDAKALVDLNKRLKQTEKEMADGEVTQLDLWAAMEDYTEAVEDATRESSDLRRARENLSRAEADAIQLEKEQERVIHELEVAYVDLAEAERTRAGLMDKEATRSATLAEIEEQRAELQRTLEDQNRQLLESGLDLMEAQAGLAEAEAEVARTGADVNGVLDAQARLFESVDTEAGELGGTLGSLADFMYEIVTAAGEVEKAFIGMSQAAALKALETGVGIPSVESQIAGARAAGVQPGTYTEFTAPHAQTAAELDAWFSSMGIDGAASGGFVKSGGLLNVHAGETIVPAGRGGGVSVVVNVEGSVTSERELVETIRRGLLRAQQSGKAVVL